MPKFANINVKLASCKKPALIKFVFMLNLAEYLQINMKQA